jgi:hypothetical protein
MSEGVRSQSESGSCSELGKSDVFAAFASYSHTKRVVFGSLKHGK